MKPNPHQVLSINTTCKVESCQRSKADLGGNQFGRGSGNNSSPLKSTRRVSKIPAKMNFLIMTGITKQAKCDGPSATSLLGMRCID